jgi:hypothetical protein
MSKPKTKTKLGPISHFFWVVNPVIIVVLAIKLLIASVALQSISKTTVSQESRINRLEEAKVALIREDDKQWGKIDQNRDIAARNKIKAEYLVEEIQRLEIIHASHFRPEESGEKQEKQEKQEKKAQ